MTKLNVTVNLDKPATSIPYGGYTDNQQQGWEYLDRVIRERLGADPETPWIVPGRRFEDNVKGIDYNWWVRFRLYGSVTDEEVDWTIELLEGSDDHPMQAVSSYPVVTIMHSSSGARTRVDRTRVSWSSSSSRDGYSEMKRQASGLEFMQGILGRLETGCPFNELSQSADGMCTPDGVHPRFLVDPTNTTACAYEAI